MSTLKWSFSVPAFLCLALTSSFCSTTELLYVQDGINTISTYRVNSTTAAAKKLGTLSPNFRVIAPNTVRRSGSFLYVLGFGPSETSPQEYIGVYPISSSGVPEAKPVQTLSVCAGSA